jgi:hypothetical protein
MNKSAVLSFLFFIAFTVSSCNDDLVRGSSTPTPAAPATIVGVWKSTGLGAVTDTKTIDASLAEIKKSDEKAATAFAAISFEFKADGTSIIPGSKSSGSATDLGKYTLSADKKVVTITSNATKDAKGNPDVQIYEIVTLTDTELKLGIAKLTAKDASGAFVVDFLSAGFIAYAFSAYVFAAKGLDVQKELAAAKTLQVTYNLAK